MEAIMGIHWASIAEQKTAAARKNTIKKLISEHNYGVGPNKWSLAELIMARNSESAAVMKMLEGVGTDGRPSDENMIKDSTGRGLVFRLRVLTRQACYETADGWAIEQRNALFLTDDEQERVLAVSATDAPVPGDIVRVKGNPLTYDPITGQSLQFLEARIALQSRIESEVGRSIRPQDATYHWTRYTVGDDGCITVPFLHAVQLLQKHGKRLVNPQWKRANGPGKNGEKPTERRITNWWFEEVFPSTAREQNQAGQITDGKTPGKPRKD